MFFFLHNMFYASVKQPLSGTVLSTRSYKQLAQHWILNGHFHGLSEVSLRSCKGYFKILELKRHWTKRINPFSFSVCTILKESILSIAGLSSNTKVSWRLLPLFCLRMNFIPLLGTYKVYIFYESRLPLLIELLVNSQSCQNTKPLFSLGSRFQFFVFTDRYYIIFRKLSFLHQNFIWWLIDRPFLKRR